MPACQLQPNLRWIRRKVDNGDGAASTGKVLQQAWMDIENGDVYWEDVPVVEGD